jgi:hypothetical protein
MLGLNGGRGQGENTSAGPASEQMAPAQTAQAQNAGIPGLTSFDPAIPGFPDESLNLAAQNPQAAAGAHERNLDRDDRFGPPCRSVAR